MKNNIIIALFLTISFVLSGPGFSQMNSGRYQIDCYSDLGQSITSNSNTYTAINTTNKSYIGSGRLNISANNTWKIEDPAALFIYESIPGAPGIADLIFSSSNIALGDSIYIDMSLSEPLRSWDIAINGVTANFSYNNKHLLIEYQPQGFATQIEFGGSFEDVKGTWTQLSSAHNLVVDSPTGSVQLDDAPGQVVGEVYPGSSSEPAIYFSSESSGKDKLFQLADVRINISPWLSIFKEISLYQGDNKLGFVLNPATNNLSIIATTQSMLDETTVTYSVRYSLKDDASLGAAFSFDLISFVSSTISGNIGTINTLADIKSITFNVISKEVPIIVTQQVDAYVGSVDLPVFMEHEEVTANVIQKLQYRLFDVSSNTYSAWLDTAYASLLRGQEGVFILPEVNGLAVSHNHMYQLELVLVGDQASHISTTNRFLVDLTPPVIPPTMNIIGNGIVGTSALRTKASAGISLLIYPDQLLDPESGIKTYEVYAQTNNNPTWLLVGSGNVVSANQVTLSASVSDQSKYYYKYRVQDKAKHWSQFSAVTSFVPAAISGNTEIIGTLFNHPNPFDSRKQKTTIYYNLNEACDINIKIYDIFGRVVYMSNTYNRDNGDFEWTGENMAGDKVSKGVYLLIFEARSLATGTKKTKKYKIGVIH
ncbi:MAG TPA: hypothetical protein DCS13_11360 [Candidatus Margulisbacteria bacterium]|nr:MAG: hypothetical protein A2X43_01370 [Candidatus Margulisbacteria bacterium GWD2_39_127]OGI05609.1 MAG: hypothetical protein A2X42_08940 [Candidatus Margulisbacteria bacterium GWF2_38_17]OGI07566.1 MAG: hypothetical protein A2X41_08845 [Candidatus Margulisbacteria bacterium GWE2_39_32]HAR64052.1 hypothetical protein [Candidatus Margulisiibacteriota bacterium]